MNQKQKVLAFLKSKTHMVISTVGHSSPEAALVGFGQTESLEIIFGTNSSTRKYKNLEENQKVACVVGFGEEKMTVQYEGNATKLSQEEIAEYVPPFHKKVPGAVSFHSHPGQTYWKITPTWIRYSNFNDEPEVFEINF